MNQYIEDNQKIIFAKFGINPEAGMKDLRKITILWKEEKEIIQLLMFTATKEELVLQEALTSTSNLQQTEMQDNLIKVQFQQMQQQMDSLQNDPQQMLKVQMMMQQQISMMAPEQRQEFAKQLMESLPPQQREQIQKLQEQQQQQQTQTPKKFGISTINSTNTYCHAFLSTIKYIGFSSRSNATAIRFNATVWATILSSLWTTFCGANSNEHQQF